MRRLSNSPLRRLLQTGELAMNRSWLVSMLLGLYTCFASPTTVMEYPIIPWVVSTGTAARLDSFPDGVYYGHPYRGLTDLFTVAASAAASCRDPASALH